MEPIIIVLDFGEEEIPDAGRFEAEPTALELAETGVLSIVFDFEATEAFERLFDPIDAAAPPAADEAPIEADDDSVEEDWAVRTVERGRLSVIDLFSLSLLPLPLLLPPPLRGP